MEDIGGREGRRSGKPSGAWGWLFLLAAMGTVSGLTASTDRDRGGREGAGDGAEWPAAQVAGHDQGSPIGPLAFSPDGSRLALGIASGEVRIANPEGTRRRSIRRGAPHSTNALAFSPDGKTLAVAGDSPMIRLHDARTGEEVESLRVDGTHFVRHVAFSPDGRRLAAGGSGGVLVIWDGPGRRPTVLRDPDGGISSLRFSPDGSLLATGDSAGLIRIWDAATGERRMSLPGRGLGDAVTSLAFSPDGSTLASACFLKCSVSLWDLRAGGPLRSLPGGDHGTWDLAFSPDGRLLAQARGDGTLRLWGVDEGRELASVGANGRPLHALSFSNDGRTLVTGGADGMVRAWEISRALAGARGRRG